MSCASCDLVGPEPGSYTWYYCADLLLQAAINKDQLDLDGSTPSLSLHNASPVLRWASLVYETLLNHELQLVISHNNNTGAWFELF